MRRRRAGLGALAALAALPAAAKVDDPNDLIQGRWHATELIIFERTEPADPGTEALVWKDGRAWPAGMRAFAEPEPWRIAGLDPLTRACLEFPRLDLAPPTTPAQCPEAEPHGSGAAQPRPGVEANPLAMERQARLRAREGRREGAVGVDGSPARNPFPVGAAAGIEGVPPPDGARGSSSAPGVTAERAPVPCPPTSAASGMAPVALGPPPAIAPDLAPHPLLNLLRAAARQQEALRGDGYRWLPERTHALKAEARRIRNAPGLDIIWHGKWMQPVPGRSAGEPLMLTAQPTPSRGRLSGTLQVTLGRFLHFNATLWLEERRDDRDGAVSFMQLSEARTMRLEELHYLDHPRLGVLVRINRVPPAPALVRALRTWEASVNG